MGFNRKVLPNLTEFKKRLEDDPKMLDRIMMADSVSGPTETIEYLEHLIEEKNREKKDKKESF